MYAPEQLTTARLLLRRAGLRDAEAIFEGYAQDPEVSRYVTWRPHESLAETRDFLARVEREFREGVAFQYAICEQPSDACIGMIGIHRDNAFCVHLGYVLRRDRWGHGFATEALRACLEVVKDEPSIFRAYAVCDVENRASARVMEKADLRYEGLLRRAILHPNAGNEPRDLLSFAWAR
jgi:RimJ/RimL family protein N-acetyltransferase